MKRLLIPLFILQLKILNVSAQGTGLVLQLVTDSPNTWDPYKILKKLNSSPKIHEYHVKTNVSNRYAETVVTSKIENKEIVQTLVTFAVTLPNKAYITNFLLDMNGKTYKATVEDSTKAKNRFNPNQKPQTGFGFISVRDSTRFSINVNIESKTNATFSLHYEEMLERQHGQYEIVTTLHPGQIVENLTVTVDIQESDKITFVKTPPLRTGGSLLNINDTKLDPQSIIKRKQTSAKIIFKPTLNRQLHYICSGLGSKSFDGLAGQFIVQYDVLRNDQGGEVMFQDGFFINFFAPINMEPLTKHAVFILDTSGSMNGLKIEKLKESMMTILSQLQPNDLINIIEFSTHSYVWDLNAKTNRELRFRYSDYGKLSSILQNQNVPDAVKASPQLITKTKDIVANFKTRSSTNIISGLEVGLYQVERVQLKYPNKYFSFLVFLTDGDPNEGISRTEEIIDVATKVNKAKYDVPIYSLSYGAGANETFLSKLSFQNPGFHQHIYEHKDSAIQLRDFYDIIAVPLLNNVTFNLPVSNHTSKSKFPVFFNGSEITVVGSGANVTNITISAKGSKGLLQLHPKIKVPIVRLNRLWAYLTVKQLLEESNFTNFKRDDLTKFAREIALKYNFVTDVSSMVNEKGAVHIENAFNGLKPNSAELADFCTILPGWIANETTTEEPTTTEMPTTTEIPTTTELPTTTEIPTTMELPTTTEIPTTTELPTTTVIPTTTTTTSTTTPAPPTTYVTVSNEHIFTFDDTTSTTTTPISSTTTMATTTATVRCVNTRFGCCSDGVSIAKGTNYTGCYPNHVADDCGLGQDVGSCRNYIIMWYFDINYGGCSNFYYGGCGGNNNRFVTREACSNVCEKGKRVDKCNLPLSVGMPRGQPFFQWHYNKNKKKCLKFLYKGALGNSNRFDTKRDCNKACSPTTLFNNQIPETQKRCYLRRDPGPCSNFVNIFYYDVDYGECRTFQYGGCGGNKNRFNTELQCTKTCIKPRGKKICFLPQSRGSCSNWTFKWHYNVTSKACEEFYYGGCKGNANRFDSEKECANFCHQTTPLPPDPQDVCSLTKSSGSCNQKKILWGYDMRRGICSKFQYNGCGGNENRFDTEADCKFRCVHPLGLAKCKLPVVPGSGSSAINRWYFNKKKGICEKFVYSGLNGNSNNFNSFAECTTECGKS